MPIDSEFVQAMIIQGDPPKLKVLRMVKGKMPSAQEMDKDREDMRPLGLPDNYGYEVIYATPEAIKYFSSPECVVKLDRLEEEWLKTQAEPEKPTQT